MKTLFLFLALSHIINQSASSAFNLACQEVRYVLSTSKGFNLYEMPSTPQSGDGLQICPQGPTCCTAQMERRLGEWSALQFIEAVNRKAQELASPLKTQVKKLNDYMEVLFDSSQNQFHSIFTRTYGVLYERNARLFQDFFGELRNYYSKGKTNLMDTTSSFFAVLFQKMFQVMNAQYNFDEAYLTCVAENMNRLRPFGDVPLKMATSVKRSMVATRALTRSLESGISVIEELARVKPSGECLRAVQRMNSCPACQGLPELKPCSNYCINVMKGCMAYHIELQNHWDKFLDGTSQLLDRLSGPFNVESVVFPIDISVSDAIMNFQESGFQITQKVFDVCGKPRLVKRNEKGGPFIFEAPKEPKFFPNGSKKPSEFDKIVVETKKIVKESYGFWRELPFSLCENGDDDDDRKCWNGRAQEPYERPLTPDGLSNQLMNPEVEIREADVLPTAFKEQKFRLQSVSNQLRLANGGQDVEWIDQESDFDEFLIEGSGAAFYGSGDFFEGSNDDDDFDLDGSGFGEEEEEDGWTKWSPFDTEFSTTTTTTTTTDITISEEEDSSAAGSSSFSKLRLVQVVMMYLLPVGVTHLSSVLTEIMTITV